LIKSASSLWQMSRGKSGVVTGFDDTIKTNIRLRLEELGFHEGAVVTCSMAPAMGAPKLYQVANSIYSLEKPLAELVQIQALQA
jgi:Fe2+ transport system protein FeoA